jgi:tetratricopeptide (TPR) repeat protein
VLRGLLRILGFIGCFVLPVLPGWAQATPQVSLDTSETIFSVLAAINACGYDQELSASDPVRSQVRTELVQAAENSERAKNSLEEFCTFYRDHSRANPSFDLAQYLSLALVLGEPPAFAPKVKEADVPPDASYVLGIVPRLQRFAINSDLHQIWLRHQPEYTAAVDRIHSPVSQMLVATDVYLRRPSGHPGVRRLLIYADPLGAPSQVNSRNYGTDYFVIVSPGPGPVKMDALRHAYLHFVLDPMAVERGLAMQRLAPILEAVKSAPMDQPFKQEVSLLVTESLIRAIEARLTVAGRSKEAESQRQRLAQKAAEEGFVLAPYFERQLESYEKSDEGLELAYPTWLHDIDASSESKRASKIAFASSATPESMQRVARRKLLDEAEKRFAAGDLKGATELAQQALDEKRDDPARAFFVLAQVATAQRDINGARNYFQRVLGAAHEPRLIAWSHIYLGRICDLQAERAQAVGHYQAALQAGDNTPGTRAAAQRGLQRPYEPPHAVERSPGQTGAEAQPAEEKE